MLRVWKIPHQPRLPRLVWKVNSLSYRQDRCGIFLIFHFPLWVLFVVWCLPLSSQLSVTGHNKDQRTFLPSLHWFAISPQSTSWVRWQHGWVDSLAKNNTCHLSVISETTIQTMIKPFLQKVSHKNYQRFSFYHGVIESWIDHISVQFQERDCPSLVSPSQPFRNCEDFGPLWKEKGTRFGSQEQRGYDPVASCFAKRIRRHCALPAQSR